MNCGDYLIIVHLSGHSNIKWKYSILQYRLAWILHFQTQQPCLHSSNQSSSFEVDHHAGYHSSFTANSHRILNLTLFTSVLCGKNSSTDSALIIVMKELQELLSSQKGEEILLTDRQWAGDELGENSGRWGATDRIRGHRERKQRRVLGWLEGAVMDTSGNKWWRKNKTKTKRFLFSLQWSQWDLPRCYADSRTTG